MVSLKNALDYRYRGALSFAFRLGDVAHGFCEHGRIEKLIVLHIVPSFSLSLVLLPAFAIPFFHCIILHTAVHISLQFNSKDRFVIKYQSPCIVPQPYPQSNDSISPPVIFNETRRKTEGRCTLILIHHTASID